MTLCAPIQPTVVYKAARPGRYSDLPGRGWNAFTGRQSTISRSLSAAPTYRWDSCSEYRDTRQKQRRRFRNCIHLEVVDRPPPVVVAVQKREPELGGRLPSRVVYKQTHRLV